MSSSPTEISVLLGCGPCGKDWKELYSGGLTKIITEFDQIRHFLLWELEV